MEQYYVSVDSGGSKIKAVLTDGDFRLISAAHTGSIRSNSTPPELCDRHLADLMAQLFDGHDDIRDITAVRGCVDRRIVEAIAERGSVGRVGRDGEGVVGVAAAGLRGESLLCLSGTGATMFYITPDGRTRGGIGGYGAVVFDEGSGYHIGRMAFSAAIRYDNNYGEPTLLRDLIAEHFGMPGAFRRAVFEGVYNGEFGSPVAAVAGVTPAVGKAVRQGDAVAREILRTAGECLGVQMNALIRRHAIPQSVPMTISGGTYRTHIGLFESLCETVRRENPDRPIIRPIFEPVIGGLLREWFEQGRPFDDAARDFLGNEYRDFLFRLED